MICFNLTMISDPAFYHLGYPELRRLRRDLKHSQRSAYSCGTYSNLRTQFKAFLFCFYFKLTPVPAELTTVCLYVQFLSRTLTPPSIRNYLSGVKLLHLFSGIFCIYIFFITRSPKISSSPSLYVVLLAGLSTHSVVHRWFLPLFCFGLHRFFC